VRPTTERVDAVTWAFDVDGTLIGSIRSDRLRPGAADLLARLVERGVVVVLWSAGGADYARDMADQHGIGHYFAGFYAKQDRDKHKRYRVDHFAAEHHPQVFVDDSVIDLPVDSCMVEVSQFLGSNDADEALISLAARLDEHFVP
jgi:long-chain acyl-CoA synthetase